MTEFHIVQKGETLSRIAKMHGTTVGDLAKLNDLKNPNMLDVGQEIELQATAVLGVQPLFLDSHRNPVLGLEYILEYCNKQTKGKTGDDGLGKKVFTESGKDAVRILVKRFDGTLKEVGTVLSGFGNKLVTIVCSSIKLEGKTEKHPEQKQVEQSSAKAVEKPLYEPKAKQPPTLDKKELGLIVTPVKSQDGKPLMKVEGDIPGLDFLGGYTDKKITSADYEDAAKKLGCEVEVIKAIAKQETGKLEALGLGAFDKKNRPTILYERHIFSRVTNNAYDKKYPDLSSDKEYLAGTAKNAQGKKYDDGNHYGLFSWQYQKLAKAYQLDPEAAIQACSWGKFQVLGTNYELCGFTSAINFAKSMCKSELEHLNVMVAFCKGNNLENALKKRDWIKIARIYNGPKYKKNKYDTELEAHYKAFKKGN